MKATIVYISLTLIFVCFPTKSRGQYVRKENTSNVHQAVILHSDGLFPSAIWELGRILRDPNTGATIRHTVNKGNGKNLNVNSRLPRRLLIAPTDLPGTFNWSQAMGFTAENNNNLEPLPKGDYKQGGCSTYKIPSGDNFPGYIGVTKWRLPTQRELQLIWLLRDAIDQAFLPRYWSRHQLSGTYWASTEENASQAWYFNFNGPFCNKDSKEKLYKVRCVSDY